jgi:hypothetical protein
MTTTNILSVDVARPGDTVFLRGNTEQIMHDHDLNILVEQLADRDVHVVFVNTVDAVIDEPAPPADPEPAQPVYAVPTEPGVYLDKYDDIWLVDPNGTIHNITSFGSWSPDGAEYPQLYTPYRRMT